MEGIRFATLGACSLSAVTPFYRCQVIRTGELGLGVSQSAEFAVRAGLPRALLLLTEAPRLNPQPSQASHQ